MVTVQNPALWSIVVAVVLTLWTIPWKGVALWRAARRRHLVWFIILLLVNTLGILEIVYIFVFSNRKRPVKQRSAEGFSPRRSRVE